MYEMHLKMGLTRTLQMWWCMICQHEFLLASTKKSSGPSNTSTQLLTLGWSMLPRRKRRKSRIMLNLCPSHTEIFSKRRKIYSWLCERLELMLCALKTNTNSKCSWQCFWFWSWSWLMNGRETETRREQKLDEDMLLHSDISKSSRNSENTSKS